MADPTGISQTALLRPLGNIGGVAGNKIQQQFQDHNVVAANARGTELAENVQEENKRQMDEGLIDRETARKHAEDAKKYGDGIIDTQDKSKHNLGAMRQAKKNEKGLEDIQGDLSKVDARVRHDKNDEKADQVIASANGNSQ